MSEPLQSISPIDGRYRPKLLQMQNLCSEIALIKYRLLVEIKYLELLKSELGEASGLTADDINLLERVYSSFTLQEAARVKQLETKLNHDIVAVVDYLRLKAGPRKGLASMVHFGLTSDDVNNLAYSLMLRNVLQTCYLPAVRQLIKELLGRASKYRGTAMLSHTHGQKASPTTLGKEFATYAYRISRLALSIARLKLPGKLNGATGNYNALVATYPEIDWIKVSNKFIKSFGLDPEPYTTQVLPHERLSELLSLITILTALVQNLDLDLWLYTSLGYLNITRKGIGSSTMPHKTNPVEFENAEGNCKIGIALLSSLSTQLMMSRMQRDLSDSTIKRNYCVGIAHCLLAIKSTTEGLRKIQPNLERISHELDSHAEVLGEVIQHILRRQGDPKALEKTAKLLKAKQLTTRQLRKSAEKIGLHTASRDTPTSPHSYTGLAEKLASQAINQTRKNLRVLERIVKQRSTRNYIP